MQDFSNDASEQSLALSRSSSLDNWPSWWNASVPLITKSNFVPNLDMNMNSLAQEVSEISQFGRRKPDCDSLSSQSTSQAYKEASGTGGSSLHVKCASAQSGIGSLF